ncbi:hypothetical protein [Moorena sp. SIO3H5]|nr:hypothetical protein [Moorena sp. SIO3H5]
MIDEGIDLRSRYWQDASSTIDEGIDLRSRYWQDASSTPNVRY